MEKKTVKAKSFCRSKKYIKKLINYQVTKQKHTNVFTHTPHQYKKLTKYTQTTKSKRTSLAIHTHTHTRTHV